MQKVDECDLGMFHTVLSSITSYQANYIKQGPSHGSEIFGAVQQRFSFRMLPGAEFLHSHPRKQHLESGQDVNIESLERENKKEFQKIISDMQQK